MSVDFRRTLADLEHNAGLQFKDKTLLIQALTHRSFAQQNKHAKDNERLEFFGDAVLKLIVSDFLFHKFPSYSEGQLTKTRAQIISDKLLAKMASHIRLGNYIRFSYGEEHSGGKTRPSNLADTFEAILGALYIDRGYEKTKDFFISLYEKMDEKFDDLDLEDYKTILQEKVQKNKEGLPIYTLEKTDGPEHKKLFFISVSANFQNQTFQGKGQGISKKEAEQLAAKDLFDEILEKV